jgi:UDPglucose 6-dehydrogenase
VENHDLLVVGTENPETENIVKECHGNYPQKTVTLGYTEAEMIKYYSNAFNALRIIFANGFYEICEALGADYKAIKDAYILRGGIADIYLDVNDNFRGYGGTCLPKDVKALVHLCKKHDLDLTLFETIDRENSKLRTTVFDGMRL